MEKYYQVINLCSEVDRKDLSEFLQDLLDMIKPELEEMDDPDYTASSEEEEDEDEIDEGEPPSRKNTIEEENYEVRIDENGFWSFVFSSDEED
jgi:hypothetical protein